MRLGAALAASVASEEPALVALAAHEQLPAKADGVNAPSHFSTPITFLASRPHFSFSVWYPSEAGRGRSIINMHKAHVPGTVIWKRSFALPAAPNTRRAVSRRGNA
jgi:hypothetical protein